MTHPIDAPLRFLASRGTLYAAGSDAPDPDMTVMRGRFVKDWPAAWQTVGNTDPETCIAEWESDRATVWTLSLMAISMAPQKQAEPFAMIGWESEDDRDRLIVAVVDYGLAVERPVERPSDRWPLRFVLAPTLRAYSATKGRGRNIA